MSLGSDRCEKGHEPNQGVGRREYDSKAQKYGHLVEEHETVDAVVVGNNTSRLVSWCIGAFESINQSIVN